MAWDDLRLRVVSRIAGIIRGKRFEAAQFIHMPLYYIIQSGPQSPLRPHSRQSPSTGTAL
jgi:hypothetical protein